MIKQTLKHRRPGFNESNYGFRSFSDLLQDAADRGFLKMAMDERSGGYVILAIQRDDWMGDLARPRHAMVLEPVDGSALIADGSLRFT